MGLLDKLFGNSGNDSKKEYGECEPIHTSYEKSETEFFVTDVFSVKGSGTIAVGMVTSGTFSVGDKVKIVNNTDSCFEAVIIGIEQFRKMCKSVSEGDNAGFLLRGVQRSDIKKESIIIKI